MGGGGAFSLRGFDAPFKFVWICLPLIDILASTVRDKTGERTYYLIFSISGRVVMKESKFKKELISWIRTIAIAVILGVIVNSTVIASTHVISGSMEDTVMTNSRVMGFRLSYLIGEPGRFDIIVFNTPENDSSIPYVKRIIGLPNEKVEIIDGKVFIDDSDVPLDDSFVKGVAQGSYGPFHVPENSYFVLGDNRNSSVDSRHWVNKYVKRGDIIGKLYFEYFPTPRLLD